VAKCTFVTSGLEHLGIAALSAYVKAYGHESTLVYEPKPFSSNSGPDSALCARLFEPTPEETAHRIAATRPDVVAFSSYTITHRWSVDVARALKQIMPTPIVFGGPHVSGSPARSISEPAIDAVVEGEGEGALLDLLACAAKDRFERSDVANVWFKGKGELIANPVRPLIADLDTLPWADKAIFYDHMPTFEREFYVISRRGCPFRCSFCEYSIFPKQYPGEKPVRRRSIEHLIGELRYWKARGRIRKVFFWDAIFTLDVGWMRDFAAAYRHEIGLPFECYTHPHAMSRDMAGALADAGCSMVRVGVQTVNSDTLAEMDRKGNRERVHATVNHLRELGIHYSLDHILGLPGEGPQDQREALRFYNEVRPARIVVHWMTYFPGTTALERAQGEGVLSSAQVERILRGEQTEGYEAPRLVGPGAHKDALDEIRHLEVLFDLLPLVPRRWIDWLLESGTYRLLPRGMAVRQLLALALALVGDAATRDRIFVILGAALRGILDGARARRFASTPKRRNSAADAEISVSTPLAAPVDPASRQIDGPQANPIAGAVGAREPRPLTATRTPADVGTDRALPQHP
jgi:anaerobic magnesium-protoporphyrin IX monomethyl ester cyclase